MSFKDPIEDHAERQMRTSVVPYANHNQKSLRNDFHSSSNSTDTNRFFSISRWTQISMVGLCCCVLKM